MFCPSKLNIICNRNRLSITHSFHVLLTPKVLTSRLILYIHRLLFWCFVYKDPKKVSPFPNYVSSASKLRRIQTVSNLWKSLSFVVMPLSTFLAIPICTTHIYSHCILSILPWYRILENHKFSLVRQEQQKPNNPSIQNN